MGPDNSLAYQSGVLAIGQGRFRPRGGDGHLHVMSVNGEYPTLREAQGITPGWIFSVVPISNADGILALGESKGVHLYDFANNAICQTLTENDLGMSVVYDLCFFERTSLLVGRTDLRIWRIDPIELSESEYVGQMAVEEKGIPWCLTCNENLGPSWILAGLGEFSPLCVQIWDIFRMCKISSFEGHKKSVHGIQITPTGIATGSEDQSVRIWDWKAFTQVSMLDLGEPIYSILCPEEREHMILAGGSSSIHVLDQRRMDSVRCSWKIRSSSNMSDGRGSFSNPIVRSLSGIDVRRFSLVTEDGTAIVRQYEGEGRILTETKLLGEGWSICFVPPFGEGGGGASVEANTKAFFLDSELVTRGRMLGAGGEGKVYFGKYRMTKRTELSVAIKRFIVAKTEEAAKAFEGRVCSAPKLEHEIRLMTELDHENILQCYGCYFEEDEMSPDTPVVSVLLEYCAGGHLGNWLADHAGRLSPLRKLTVMLQIARGMFHMHGRKIIHSDLSLDNVLVTSVGLEGALMKVSDFGLSNHFGTLLSAELKGKPRYLPPSRSGNKTKIDVYSYGILAWEIWNEGVKAYSREGLDGFLDPFEFVERVRSRNLRPKISDCVGMPQEVRDLVTLCWSTSPDDRPSFRRIAEELEDLISQLEAGNDLSPIVQTPEVVEEKAEEMEEDSNRSDVDASSASSRMELSEDQEQLLVDIVRVMRVPDGENEDGGMCMKTIRGLIADSRTHPEATWAVFEFLRNHTTD